MTEPLKKNPKMNKRRGPVLLVIMDGVGYGKYADGDAVAHSKMPNLRALENSCPHTKLKAHGLAVGLPSDADMGNSEVGHNAMGAGRVFAQGAKLVSQSIESRALFNGDTWKKLIDNVKKSGGTLHFIGLVSDGNVHSHIDHLKAMLKEAKAEGVAKVRVHGLLDGRDVGETSALEYFTPLEEEMKAMSGGGFDARFASGGGRMVITMDRYNANWEMRKPVGTINDGDSVILFNFRGDRALEITAAFEGGSDFNRFDRKRVPKVEYAGMMEYDGDLHIPKQYLVSPPQIDRTMGEYLAKTGVRSFAISETQKYGHVTYFFNGNKLGKFDEKLETYEEIPSDIIPFEQKPLMKCKEITDRLLEVISSGKYDFIRVNYPNGDMVGHTGVWNAVIQSMEGLDVQIGRLREAIEKAGGVMIVTADHGNSDDMFEHDKAGNVKRNSDGTPKAKTAHSLNPVPCIVFDPEYKGEYDLKLNEGLGISSIAATCIDLLGYEPPVDYDKSVLNFK